MQRIKILAVAAIIGLGGLLAQSGGCIIPDYCIKIQTLGKNNCRYLVNAQMWPAGDPGAAVPVPSSAGAPGPAGCVCFNSDEQGVIDFGIPLGHWNDLRDEMEAAARNACSALAAQGWDNNCHIDSGPNASTPSSSDFTSGTGDCIGNCVYTNPPPKGSCPDPNPYECNGEPGGAGGPGETGETDTGDEPGGLGSGNYIACVGNSCDIDAVFAQGLYDDPTLLLVEGTTLVYDRTVSRFVFEGVSSGSLADELRLQTGDRLEWVGSAATPAGPTTIHDFDSAVQAMIESKDATFIGVRVLRGTSWVDLSYTFI